VLENKYYIDELYALLIEKPLSVLSSIAARLLDQLMIDCLVVSLGQATRGLGQRLRIFQTGDLQLYAFAILAGIVSLLAVAYRYMSL
jgi:NADH-quinone oxidoreductase subunit L